MDDIARTPKQIGTAIQRARKQRGWTQTELARRAGLRQGTVSDIETGEKPAKMASVLSLLAALELEFRIGPRDRGGPDDIATLF
ncbi:helix-turn-helix domain-containing protein [Sagittula sp. S175]|uniref:helix-turn-helix domain-containing protein n=1 Tax=Sagittula sp. S175 TaxID=3415129 RepID=UPI003C7A344B